MERLLADALAGIREFVAVADAGSFSAAADRLGLTRSAIGKSVARIEVRLGTRLFHRTTRSLSLTPEGHVYFEHCQRALAEIRAGAAALESGQIEPSGTVRLTAPVIIGRQCVAPILFGLARRHRQLKLEMVFTDRSVDLVEEGFDLAIRNGGLPNAAGLKTRALGHQRMLFCASPDYVAARGMPAGLDDLACHDTILYSAGSTKRNWLYLGPDGHRRDYEPAGHLRLDDVEAIRDAAVHGMGIAWVPAWLAERAIATGRLVEVMADIPGVTFKTWAIWPDAPQMPLRLRVVIDALAAEFPDAIAGRPMAPTPHG